MRAGPTIVVSSSGVYRHQPHWYRGFVYDEERDRGLDFVEDLGSPGEWTFELGEGEAAMVFTCERTVRDPETVPAREAVEAARAVERARRAKLGGPLDRAADQYLVARRGGRTIIAGYPWFGDWGRDTFIALRGLCLATGRVAEAIEVLSAWAGVVSQGMLPNFFPDGDAEPEYNSVDASLWYVVAVGEAIHAAGTSPAQRRSPPTGRRRRGDPVRATRRGRATGSAPPTTVCSPPAFAGQQLTWMDARVDGREITPRIGKPVEIQALWLNALAVAVTLRHALRPAAGPRSSSAGRASFEHRFWDEANGRLYDVVDVDHMPGDGRRQLPSQPDPRRRRPPAVAAHRPSAPAAWSRRSRSSLLTPLGLRSLAPGEPGYCPRYAAAFRSATAPITRGRSGRG